MYPDLLKLSILRMAIKCSDEEKAICEDYMKEIYQKENVNLSNIEFSPFLKKIDFRNPTIQQS